MLVAGLAAVLVAGLAAVPVAAPVAARAVGPLRASAEGGPQVSAEVRTPVVAVREPGMAAPVRQGEQATRPVDNQEQGLAARATGRRATIVPGDGPMTRRKDLDPRAQPDSAEVTERARQRLTSGLAVAVAPAAQPERIPRGAPRRAGPTGRHVVVRQQSVAPGRSRVARCRRPARAVPRDPTASGGATSVTMRAGSIGVVSGGNPTARRGGARRVLATRLAAGPVGPRVSPVAARSGSTRSEATHAEETYAEETHGEATHVEEPHGEVRHGEVTHARTARARMIGVRTCRAETDEEVPDSRNVGVIHGGQTDRATRAGKTGGVVPLGHQPLPVPTGARGGLARPAGRRMAGPRQPPPLGSQPATRHSSGSTSPTP